MISILAIGLLSTVRAQSPNDVIPSFNEFNAQIFRPTIDGQATLWTDDAQRAQNGAFSGRFLLSYANDPFVYVSDDYGQYDLLSDVLQANLLGGLSLGFLRVGADIPIYLFSSGEAVNSGTGLGDIALDTKANLVQQGSSPLGFALGLRFTAPTAMVDAPLGMNNGLGWEVQAIVDRRIGHLLMAANLGTRGLPQSDMADITWDDQLFYRIGGGYSLSDSAGLSADLAGLFNYSTPISDPAHPLEALLGGWVFVADSLALRGGVGTGLTRGVGAPAMRAVLALSYSPGQAQEEPELQVVAEATQPETAEPVQVAQAEEPSQAETTEPVQVAQAETPEPVQEEPDQAEAVEQAPVEPTPEPTAVAATVLADSDGDGIPNQDDSCVDEPEDKDDYHDSDGCPDPSYLADIRIIAPDGSVIPGVETTLEGEGVVLHKGASFQVELHPGTYSIKAVAEGFQPVTSSFKMPAEPTATESVVLNLEPVATLANLTLSVKDEKGRPLSGTWSIDRSRSLRFEDGSSESSLTPGKHDILVSAPGYGSVARQVDLSAGESKGISVVLEQARVEVASASLDILEPIYFDTGRASIKGKSYALLNEIAATLRSHPEIKRIAVQGHTDSKGSFRSNMRLSERRAQAVKRYLVRKGVDADRLLAVGYGEARPLDTANTREAWARNRRVEFKILERAAD